MNEELFDSGNILNGDDLFGEEQEGAENSGSQTENSENEEQEKEKEKDPTEILNPDEDLFGGQDEEEEEEEEEEESESVGEEENKKKSGNRAELTGSGSSPKGFNPYSSFAKALYGDGLFQNLDEKTVNGIEDADAFYDALESEINARLDEKTKRINEALESGMQIDEIQRYENTIQQLDKITEDVLSEESERGKNLRISIIRQDFLNRGFTKERADREVKRSVDSGNDKEDAKEALDSCKEFYENKYEELREAGKQQLEQDKKRAKQEAADFKKAVLETDKIFGDIPVDKATRQKAYEYMTKPVKTTDDGERLTAVQVYADEHPVEFRSMLGFIAALTDGFSKMGNLFNKSVNKKVRQNLADIEKKVSRSSHQGGTISFAEGEEEEPETPRGRYVLDI